MNKFPAIRSSTLRNQYIQEMYRLVLELEALTAKLYQVKDPAIVKQITQMLENINRQLPPARGESEIVNYYTRFDRDS